MKNVNIINSDCLNDNSCIDKNNLIDEIENKLSDKFKQVDNISLANVQKVLAAFNKHRVSQSSFNGTTGYGYGDVGRETLCNVYAEVFGTEAAIVSPHISCGTHALTITLFGLLKSGDCALSITGQPYDTLSNVIDGPGGLNDYKIKFKCVPLTPCGEIDLTAIKMQIEKLNPKIIYVQRSRGYNWRASFDVAQLKKVFKHIRTLTDALIVVDNCYGEFTEKLEPTQAGADIIVGSLIKNPGGGLAVTGGYIAGPKYAINLINGRLNSPSLGGEVGSYEGSYRQFFQGLFLAPHVTAQALKGVLLMSALLRKKGYECMPGENDILSDIICSVKLNDRKKMLNFCNAVQQNSPVDSFVLCEPSDMPGYNDPVIMAAGTFIQGASIELSCDGTVKPPYIAYLQGGLTYEHIKLLAQKIVNF